MNNSMNIAGARIPVWMLLLYIAALIAVLAWPIMAFMSVFAFDAPGSSSNPQTYVAVGLLLCYPILPVGGVLGSYLTYRKQHKLPAYILAGVALLPSALLLIVLVIMPLLTTFAMFGGNF